MNLAICIGRLTRDPEMRFTPSGQAMCRFDLAVNRSYKDRDGNWAKDTTYIPIVVWGRQAETCEKFLKKGRQTCVRGRMEIRTYDDKNGEKRKAFQLNAERVEFLGERNEGGGYQSGSNRSERMDYPDPMGAPDHLSDVTDEDIPF